MTEIRIIKMVLNLLRCHICRVENYPPKALKSLEPQANSSYKGRQLKGY